MKQLPWKYIIAGAVILALAWVGISALSDSSIEYATVDRAEKLGKTVQIIGTWEKSKGWNYDAQSNTFAFTLRDEQRALIPVELIGAKPNNFEAAVSVVVKGRIDDGVLKASNVLTKCPSKYEGQPTDAMPAS